MSTRTRSRRVLALNAVVLSVGLAACSADSAVSAGSSLPAAKMSTTADQVASITSDPTVVALFGPSLSSGSVTTFTRTADAGALFTRLASAGAGALHFTRSANGSLVPAAPRLTTIGTSGGMTIPVDMRGWTYVHDASNNYVIDSAATGAPANGFRIMLYAWNPTAPQGQQWGATIGYADVMDEGTTSEDKIVVNMFATGGATPVVSFKVADATVDASTTADTLAGTVNAAGGKTMSYQFAGLTTGIGTATPRTVTNLHVDVPGSTFQVDGTLIDGLQSGDVQSLSAKFGSDAVVFSIPTVLSSGAYTTSDTTSISVNGKLAGYILANAGAGQPMLVRPDGTEMSADQKLAVAKVLETFGQVFMVVAVTSLFALWAIALGLMV